MIVLADNDIVYKLAACHLLEDFMAWIKAPPHEVFVLPALPFIVRKRLKQDLLALQKFENFLLQTQPLPSAKLETLASLDGFDSGEQQLLAVMCDLPEVARLITGDKRALRQITHKKLTHPQLSKRLKAVRIDCLESVFLGLQEAIGFEALRDKVMPARQVDTVLSMSFGANRDQAHMKNALGSYLEALRLEAPFIY